MLEHVLVHSPIVGPDTWEPVAAALREAGHAVAVPELRDETRPYWGAHVASAVAGVIRGGVTGPVVLVAHSGAGRLLAHIGGKLEEHGVRVACYLFVDADLPTDGESRLQHLPSCSPTRSSGLLRPPLQRADVGRVTAQRDVLEAHDEVGRPVVEYDGGHGSGGYPKGLPVGTRLVKVAPDPDDALAGFVGCPALHCLSRQSHRSLN